MAISLSGKTYWLLGASEGLGRAVAMEMAGAGARLCLSARSEDRLRSLAEDLPGDHTVATCNVRDSHDVRAAFEKLPALDGVVFCAGLYEPTKTQEWDADKVEAMCDVNFTGAVRVLGQVVPAMVTRGRGHIVLIGSLAGFRGVPGAIGYASCKAGLIHLAESMRIDLPTSTFDVQVINPGYIKTRLTDKNDFEMPHIMEPEDAAVEVRKAMQSGEFSTEFPSALARRFKIARVMPDGLYFKLARR